MTASISSRPQRNVLGSYEWPVRSVGDIAESIQYGYTASAVDEADGPRFLRITDIQDGQVDWSSVPSCSISDEEVEKYRLRSGDIVFARTGATTGKSFLIGAVPDAVFASYLIRIRPNNSVDPRYLAAFFQSADYWRQIEAGKRGIGQPNVNSKTLADIRLPLPPLERQTRVVTEIEKQFTRLDAGLIALKRALSNNRRRHASLLSSLFAEHQGWPRKQLGTIATKIGSGSTPRGGEAVYQSTGVPLIRSMNVHSTGFRYDGLARISAADAERLRHVIVQGGDVLLNITGASIGRVTTAPPDLVGARVNQHVCIIRPEPALLPEFLAAFLATPAEQARVMNVQVGATRQALTKEMVSNWMVPVPPLREQQHVISEIARNVEASTGLGRLIDTSIRRATRLHQAILQRAFSGQLV